MMLISGSKIVVVEFISITFFTSYIDQMVHMQMQMKLSSQKYTEKKHKIIGECMLKHEKKWIG